MQHVPDKKYNEQARISLTILSCVYIGTPPSHGLSSCWYHTHSTSCTLLEHNINLMTRHDFSQSAHYPITFQPRCAWLLERKGGREEKRRDLDLVGLISLFRHLGLGLQRRLKFLPSLTFLVAIGDRET